MYRGIRLAHQHKHHHCVPLVQAVMWMCLDSTDYACSFFRGLKVGDEHPIPIHTTEDVKIVEGKIHDFYHLTEEDCFYGAF